MEFAHRLFLLALVTLLTAEAAFAVPCVPFPGAWTGAPAKTESLSNWVGLVYDHNSGCDSPVLGATFNLQTSNNESSIQVYIAQRRDGNLTVAEPRLLYDSEVSGDGNFHNVSFGATESTGDFTLQSGAQYLIIVKASAYTDEEIGVDSENGYVMWNLTHLTFPGDDDIWTSSANSKLRVWFHLMPSCDGVLADQSGVCGGHGQCVGFDNCACETGYAPPFCNSTQGGSSLSSSSPSDHVTSSSPAQSSAQGSTENQENDNMMPIVLSIVGAVVIILVILVIIVVVIVVVIVGIVYYQQHRYPLPRTYSRPFAEMPGKDTEFSPMAI